jgi:hypothetical protein
MALRCASGVLGYLPTKGPGVFQEGFVPRRAKRAALDDVHRRISERPMFNERVPVTRFGLARRFTGASTVKLFVAQRHMKNFSVLIFINGVDCQSDRVGMNFKNACQVLSQGSFARNFPEERSRACRIVGELYLVDRTGSSLTTSARNLHTTFFPHGGKICESGAELEGYLSIGCLNRERTRTCAAADPDARSG